MGQIDSASFINSNVLTPLFSHQQGLVSFWTHLTGGPPARVNEKHQRLRYHIDEFAITPQAGTGQNGWFPLDLL